MTDKENQSKTRNIQSLKMSIELSKVIEYTMQVHGKTRADFETVVAIRLLKECADKMCELNNDITIIPI